MHAKTTSACYFQLAIILTVASILVGFPLVHAATTTRTDLHSAPVLIKSSDATHITLVFDARQVSPAFESSNRKFSGDWVLSGEGILTVTGQPILPSFSRFVVVPAGKSIEFVVKSGLIRTEKALLPPVTFVSGSDSPVMSTENIFEDGLLFPPNIVEVSAPMAMRGVNLVRISTFPVQFNQQTQSYLIHDEIEVDLRFSDNPILPVPKHTSFGNRSQSFQKFLDAIAINPEQPQRDNPDSPESSILPGHYLVICLEDCIVAVAPFIEWRRKAGYKVDIFSVASEDANDTAAIKAEIQRRYDQYLEGGTDPFDMILLVGDHTYQGIPPEEESMIATPNYGWDYTLLEGGEDDPAPDVAIGQWIAGTPDQLTPFLVKTLSYEMDPYFEDTGWFNRAAVFSQHWGQNWDPSLQMSVRWASEMLEEKGFSDIRTHEILDQDYADHVTEFLYNQFNEGVNVMVGRAQARQLAAWLGDIDVTGIYPVYINYAGHQEYLTWPLLRVWNGRDIKGPVAATNIHGVPSTLSNNALWLENVSALFQKDLNFGWARMYGVIAPELYLPDYEFRYNIENSAAYGDPGLQPWIGVPKVVSASIPDIITTMTRSVEIVVFGAEDEHPVEGAMVTLYFPGDLPDPDSEEYPTYNGMASLTQMSEADGSARFFLTDFTPLEVDQQMFVTITGREIKPFLDSLTIRDVGPGAELSRYSLSEVSGNGDTLINPGERWSAMLIVKNLNEQNDLANVIVTAISNSPWLTIDSDTVFFGNIDHGDSAAAEQPISLNFDHSCPDGFAEPSSKPSISINIASGNQQWQSAIEFDPYAPKFVVERISGGGVINDSLTAFDIELSNTGRLGSSGLIGNLISLNRELFIVERSLIYERIDPDHVASPANRGKFVVARNSFAIPGTVVPLLLSLSDDNGFCDTVTFSLRVGAPREGSPLGPDLYGYSAYDHTDIGWVISPQFQWFEIDPRSQVADADGERIDFSGQSEYDIGETIEIDLPFSFQFYGEEYVTICVATNGFVSMGEQPEITNFENWPLDRCVGGGVGMIAPFWDDLRLGQFGKVFRYYDEENHRFIIEWSRLRHATDGESDLTFQLILIDPQFRPTLTGDGIIELQYLSIVDVQGGSMPFASIGVSSPRGDTGLSYSFNHVQPVSAATLRNRTSIIFTTLPFQFSGVIKGSVRNAANGNPIANAIVRTNLGSVIRTDVNGLWRISDAPIGQPLMVMASAQGFNDSTLNGVEIEENDSVQIAFQLLHPEFQLSLDHYDQRIDRDYLRTIPLTLSNRGNGPLHWQSTRRMLGGFQLPEWQVRQSYPVGERVDDERIEGVIFANDKFFVSGSNGDDPNLVYIFDRVGEPIGSFVQPGESHNGFKDLDWDGDLIWGAQNDSLFGFNVDGEVFYRWQSPVNSVSSIACDPENEIILLSGTVSNIYAFDVIGNQIGAPLSRKGLRIQSLAWWNEDPDDYNLYITAFRNNEYCLYKMHPASGDTLFVRTLPLSEGSISYPGSSISNNYDHFSWVILSILNSSAQAGGDKLLITQLGHNTDWFQLDPFRGTIDADRSLVISITLNTTGLPDGLTNGEIWFVHNADDLRMTLEVEIEVVGEVPPYPFNLLEPSDGDTLFALPNAGDTLRSGPVRFVWEQLDDPNWRDTSAIYIFNLESQGSLYRQVLESTTLTLSLDTLIVPLDPDNPIRWSVTGVSGIDTLICTHDFEFHFLPNGADRETKIAPVEFLLQSPYPNPFNTTVSIRYQTPITGELSLKVFDVAGREVTTLAIGRVEAGYHNAIWKAENQSSGIYFLRLNAPGFNKSVKLLLVK